MKCPHCGDGKSQTTNSRKRGFGVYRRRRCPSCKHVWTTTEQIGSPESIKSRGDDITRMTNVIRALETEMFTLNANLEKLLKRVK